jgi:hypothetical protein
MSHPELERFGDVVGSNLVVAFEIGNRPRHLSHPVESAGAERQPRDRGVQDAKGCAVGGAVSCE